MYRIGKTFRFSAAHQLWGLPEGHQCSRLHGHNYEVTFILESDCLDAVGMVRDFGDLGVAKEAVEAMDHQDLNNLFGFNPTSELLANYLFWLVYPEVPELRTVRVSESPTTWAECSPRIVGRT